LIEMKRLFLLLVSIIVLVGGAAHAQTPPETTAAIAEAAAEAAEAPATLDTGDTAWIITATALVLFMTLPGLALFYGGLVRSKNVLTVLVQCFALAAIVTVLWVAFGYSFALKMPDGVAEGTLGLHSFI